MPFNRMASVALFLFSCVTVSGMASNASAASPTPVSAPISVSVLSEADIAAYRAVFALQEQAKWQAADKKLAQIDNDVLKGYVLYQRYMHPTGYRSQFGELKRWMAYYADHPNADRIYSLARKRRPKGATSPHRAHPRPWRTKTDTTMHPDLAADYRKTSGPTLRRIEGRVRYLIRRENASTALKEITRHHQKRTITTRQFDRMRSWIAASFYYQGYVDTARRLSNEVAHRNGDVAVMAYWIAGLIAFRDGQIDEAYTHFSKMAAVPHQTDDLRAGAGFWAARTALAAGKPAAVTPSLEIAAQTPFTFYGQLALAQLGHDYQYDWSTPQLTQDGLADLTKRYPALNRVIALAQVGRIDDAELEMRWLNGAIEDHHDYDLMAVAAALNLPAAQLEIALSGDAPYLDAGRFPIPHYTPANDFKVDRAVLYALMRQESKFKTEATSRVGARGLMQLMPRTASYVAKDRSLYYRKGRDRLYDPALNLQIGQTYVTHLIDRYADGDLFKMAVAYNGGPGNLRRWDRKLDIDDPLLFIESIPNSESRNYVEKVLTNIWVYRSRLGQAAPTRDKVAAGQLPLYEALDRLTQ